MMGQWDVKVFSIIRLAFLAQYGTLTSFLRQRRRSRQKETDEQTDGVGDVKGHIITCERMWMWLLVSNKNNNNQGGIYH